MSYVGERNSVRAEDFLESSFCRDSLRAEDFLMPEDPPVPFDSAIIEKDKKNLSTLNMTTKKIEEKLNSLVQRASESPSNSITLDNTFAISGHAIRKMTLEKCQHCLTQISGSSDYVIKNENNHKTLRISDLQIHWIKHGYFGEEEMRIEPKHICEVLALLA